MIEIKTAVGVEVSKSGASVSREDVQARGLVRVGKRLLEQRAGETRALNPTEQRAVELATAAAPQPTPAAEATKTETRAAETPAEKRAAAVVRFRASRPAEKRDLGFEEKLEAIWCALYDVLGSPWGMDDAEGWEIEDTYDDQVIVERAPGQYVAYPVSFDAANALTLGEPAAVVKTWVPAPAETETAPARTIEDDQLEFGI